MAELDLATCLEPVSAAEPCGPDLDFDGDMDFMNFLARADILLPQSFFSFNRAAIDFPAEFEHIRSLWQRTRDLRLLVLNAKLAILNRDVAKFAASIDKVAEALETLWPDIHPRGEDGDFIMRVSTVGALDDAPHVILPLQHATIAENRRLGAISYRSHLIASGKLAAREGETALDASTVERILFEADIPALVEKRSLFLTVGSACERIRAASIDHGGYENQINLERLTTLAGEIANAIDEAIARRDPASSLKGAEPEPLAADNGDGEGDPAAGPAGEPGAPGAGFAFAPVVGAPAAQSTVVGAIATRADALRAFRGVRAYFERYEPASPSLLLVAQAEQLMGKSLYAVMRELIPDFAARASLYMGQSAFKLPVMRLAENAGYLPPVEQTEAADAGAADAPAIEIHNRRDAMRLMDMISTFLRTAEPANPIPILLTRAKELADRDFLSLMKDVFTEPTLQSMKTDEWG
ncbi:MAG: type VI secretion system ImpA family N-terminal domain-containing protein [Hyphomicrobiaceae bacterium]|nr:type VI secretion system ImpA family N-terminal domain-containing protein [Hyphomicrobiaceae bacterium]